MPGLTSSMGCPSHPGQQQQGPDPGIDGRKEDYHLSHMLVARTFMVTPFGKYGNRFSMEVTSPRLHCFSAHLPTSFLVPTAPRPLSLSLPHGMGARVRGFGQGP